MRRVIASAPGQAKMWKERNVSVALGAGKEVNTCVYIGTYRTMGMLNGEFPSFGREKFEAYLEGGLEEYVRLVKGCLDEAARQDESFASEGMDLVILTGGHSAWYFAREILTGAMEGWLEHPALSKVRENPYRVVSLPNPQSTVALGLVYSGLPFRLERKFAQKTKQDLNQTRSIEMLHQKSAHQLCAEDKVFADITKDTEASYKWDVQLLQCVKKFIEEDPALRSTNIHNHRGDIVAQMRENFGLRHWDIIYYAMPAGIFSRKKYQAGVIISSTGLWHRDGLFKIFVEEHLEWEMFLNGVVHGATRERPFEEIEYGNMRFGCPRWAFGETGAMSRLQKLLREKSIALEEGRPI